MKNLIALVFSLSVLTSFLFGQDKSSFQNENFKSISQKANVLIQECIDYNEMVGLAAGIYKDGKVVWKNGTGYIDKENQVVAKSNMLHRTASIAKPMTAIAILQLYEQKKLKLDDPIQKHLPDYPKKRKGVITIRHLLNHSSGIKAYKTNKEAFSTKNYPTLQDAMKVFQKRKLKHKPGTDYQYTTYGYVVLGAIVESASGMSFRDYMKKNVWEKVGMKNTDVEIFGKEYPNKSKLYRKDRTGKLVDDLSTDLSIKVPGGGFHTTVDDLLKFGAAILDNKLISASTLKMMIKDSGIKKRGNPYGMGWFLYGKESDASGKLIGHSGSQSGTSTQLMVYLDKKIVVATLSNTSNTWNEVFTLTHKLGMLSLNSDFLKSPLKKQITVSKSVLDKYSGKYQLGDESMILTRRGNQLFASFNGASNQNEVFAESETKFYLRALNIEFEFEKSEDGASENMIFTTLKGKKIHPKKVKLTKSLAQSFSNMMEEKGIEASLDWLEQNKNSIDYHLKETEFNALGYELLQKRKIDAAIQVFQFNVNSFPESWNVYDSLGEAYLLTGNNELAIENYKKSVAINPENELGVEALKKLGVK